MNKITSVPDEKITNRIYYIRNRKIVLDNDLAELYGVENKQLKRQVRRNIERFPDDFMFELNEQEYHVIRCQTGTLKKGEHVKYLPFAFTEQGVAMLSGVLHSPQAISVNIQIMRIFTRVRELALTHKEILLKLETIEKKIVGQEEKNKATTKAYSLFFKP